MVSAHALACNALLLLRFYSSTRTPPRQGSSIHVQVSLLGPACSPIRRAFNNQVRKALRDFDDVSREFHPMAWPALGRYP